MPRSKKSTVQRITELDDQLRKMQEKAKLLEAQKRNLQRQQTAESRKKDTHRKIEVGAAVESVCHIPIEKEDLPRLLDMLYSLERKHNHFFSKRMGYAVEEVKSEDGKVTFLYSKIVMDDTEENIAGDSNVVPTKVNTDGAEI